MIARQSKQELLAQGEVVAAPLVAGSTADRACTDQNFELPTGLYVAMAAMFTGFVAVLALVLRGGHLAVAFGVNLRFCRRIFRGALPVPEDGRPRPFEGAELGRVQRTWNHDGDRPFDCA